MVISKDEIETFIPKKPKILILGTMGAIIARTIDDNRPKEAFYYHDNRNHFWKIIQLVFKPNIEPKKMTIDEKKIFLEEHGIAMSNIVKEIRVNTNDAKNPSDDIIFIAQKKRRLEFKVTSEQLKEIIEKKPIFFTCRSKPGISHLIQGYFSHNNINIPISKIHHLPTPTRCNPQKRSNDWRNEMEKHINKKIIV
ncbi:MAG: hypothetical protein M9962_12500 [Oligoflexia bacterium]|nr:hypothetical protein [Oligoflexia bacterium]